MDEDMSTGRGVACAPDEVWARVRADYLAGRSATECCRRHGVGLTSLRNRAAREGWRRADQPWAPPDRLDPWDEGVELEQAVGGDLDKIEYGQLAYVAHRRMMRAVMRGDAMEALRWRRVRLAMDEEEFEMAREAERQDAEIWRRLHTETDAGEVDGLDGLNGLNGVFASGDVSPPHPQEGEVDPERSGGDGGVLSACTQSPSTASRSPSPSLRDREETASETRTDLTSPPLIRDPGSLPPGAPPCPSPAPRS